MRYKLVPFIFLLLLISMSISAQSSSIVTIAVPQFWEMVFDEAVLDAFETQHGVDVQLVYSGQQPALPSALDSASITGWQDALQDYVQSADVLYVDNSILTPEVSRAGMVLNLNPLIQADAQLNPADYHPAIWETFTWDSSQWALPIGGSTTLVEYIPAIFDEKGIIYPSDTWSLSEFANAARELTEYDEGGNVTLPGMLVGAEDRTLLFHSLTQQAFNDGGQPDMPQFATDELATLFDQWNELIEEGVITSDPSGYFQRMNEIPIKIGVGGFVAITVDVGDDDTETEDVNASGFAFNEDTMQTALAYLPNQVGGVDAQGFAVSSGTENPQLAYDLVRYLSEHPNIAGLAFGAEPARLSYLTPEVESEDNGVMIAVGSSSQRSDADNMLVQETLTNGVSASDLRFGYYLTQVDGVIQGGLDAASALQTVEADVNRAVTQMMEADLTIIVNTPKQIVVPEGEILLQFGIASFVQPLPNGQEWDALASDFAANDPEVGAIEINSGFMQPNQVLSQNDCVYQPTVMGLFDLDTEKLLPIDPLLSADPDYNINDLPPTILSQMQFNGITYGLPMTIQPEVLVYNKQAFDDMGIVPPLDGWTVGELENMLRMLDEQIDNDDYPLETVSSVNTHLLMLIAAQGGRLFDTSTTPVTLDFASPASASAVMQVLDLIKADLIGYDRLGESAGFDFVAVDGDAFSNLQANNFLGFFDETLGLLPYPIGSQYTPSALGVGAGLISMDSTYPEACYRWLSYLANHPSAFTDMPALLSTLDQPETQAAFGADRLAIYQTIAGQATQPNTINPIVWDPVIMLWLNRAFDAYIFDSADLQAELENAEQLTQTYVDCIAQPLDNDLSRESVFERIQDCADQMNIN